MSRSSLAAGRGPIAWMAEHSVAANLAMFICLIGGLLLLNTMRQEVFPEFEVDVVSISVVYPGASPEEVENGIILAVEDAVSGLDGVDDINSVAKEGLGQIAVYALVDTDVQRLAQDIRKEVDRIETFPEDAEQPQITIVSQHNPVISIALSGAAEERVLHQLAENFRDRLRRDPDIQEVELSGIKPMEIAIEVPQEQLRRYGLSLGDIAEKLSQANIDLPGGSIRAEDGEVLIRTKERREYGQQFLDLPVITTSDGSQVLLADIARVTDGYDSSDYYAIYNGQPAVLIDVFNNGRRTPIRVSERVKAQLEELRRQLPDGISANVLRDMSTEYAQRIDLLLRNGALGLICVFILLALFLEWRLAFWVMVGIPVAFVGSFLVLPATGISLNMISLFAFIIALGIVVDDAIVIGENIYHYRQQGIAPLQAAVKGAEQMAVPITFSILTNIAAFVPLLYIPGFTGKIFAVIPVVVMTVFIFSWAESLFVLPYHVAQLSARRQRLPSDWLSRFQHRFGRFFENRIVGSYRSLLSRTIEYRYLTVAIAFALLCVTLSYAVSGRMGMTLFPKTEADYAQVRLTLPFGTPVEKTETVVQQLVAAARQVAETLPDGERLLTGIFAEVGTIDQRQTVGSHWATIRAYLAPPEIRDQLMGTDEFSRRWRERSGEIPGLESVLFESDAGGPGSGSALTVELNHRDIGVLQQASGELANALRAYPNVYDIDDGFSSGKEQLDIMLLPEGKSLGLTARDVARQIRNAYYGAEVVRQQRGRHEVKIMVRLPEAERQTEQNLDQLLLWTPKGIQIPLREAVSIERGRAFTEINRRNGRRVVQVEAGVSPKSRAGEILNDLKANALPRLERQFPGLQYSFEGSQADMVESLSNLKLGFALAVLAIYTMLAIPFHSYILPFIVIVSIPFGVIGAIFGHLLMGYDLSVLSTLGIVALSGIVVNDALVLIDYATQLRRNDAVSALNAIKSACLQRFRPIVLTTLTTFAGLMPMILESSRQARILIPMAISIGFGILFATLITLVLIPSFYILVEDLKKTLSRKT